MAKDSDRLFFGLFVKSISELPPRGGPSAAGLVAGGDFFLAVGTECIDEEGEKHGPHSWRHFGLLYIMREVLGGAHR
jgi:hypothetical protein